MRSNRNYAINSQEVHVYAKRWLGDSLASVKDYGPKCAQSVILEVLLLAAARLTSIFDVCDDLSRALTGRAVSDALLATLPAIVELEKELNQSLCVKAPKSLTRRKRPVAVDLTLLRYHGQPYEDEKEIYRGQAKSGTSRFHARHDSCGSLRVSLHPGGHTHRAEREDGRSTQTVVTDGSRSWRTNRVFVARSRFFQRQRNSLFVWRPLSLPDTLSLSRESEKGQPPA